MKEKVIEIAGKTWRYLGQNGETNVNQLPKVLKEKDEVVLQALGWLAREDKINYATKNRRTFVSLVEQEVRAFNSLIYNINGQAQGVEVTPKKKKALAAGESKIK
jgi:hypothetical protein